MTDDLAYPDLEEALRIVERCFSVFLDSGSLVTAFHHLNIGPFRPVYCLKKKEDEEIKKKCMN
jgi:hypothetical protein